MNISTEYTYHVFLSHNFLDRHQFQVKVVEEVARGKKFRISKAQPGIGAKSAASTVRDIMMQVEGLLVVIQENTDWVNNEIGMAYAFELPIYVIANGGVTLQGIPMLETSIAQREINNPDVLRECLEIAFDELGKEIDKHRTDFPEYVPKNVPVEIISWRKYYKTIKTAHRLLQRTKRPTLLLGISLGGIIVADILARMSRPKQLGLLEADRDTQSDTVIYNIDRLRPLLKDHLSHVAAPKIIIVDDVIKTGKSLLAAKKQLENLIKQIPGGSKATIETLVLFSQQKPNVLIEPDIVITPVSPDVYLVFPYGTA
jgi:hypoxanthine phosphoribosyltransferase